MKAKQFELVEQIGCHYIFQVWRGEEKSKKVVLHFEDIIDHSGYMGHLPNGKVLVETIDYNDPANFPEIVTERQEVSFTNEDYKMALAGEGYIQ